MMRQENSIRKYGAVLLLILVAFVFRAWNIDWSLPEIYEEATPYSVAWKMWNWGKPGLDLNPHFFNYPALTFYLTFFGQAAYYGVGHLVGWFPTLDAYRHANISDPSAWILFGRLLSVAFDVGTVIVLFFFTKAYTDRQTALLSSSLAAVNPLLIKNAQLINVDTPLTFLVMVSLYAIYRVYRSPELKWYIMSGVGIGLAASSKYNGAFLIPVLLAGHMLRTTSVRDAFRSLFSSRIVTAVFIAGFIFLILNPFILLSFKEFQRDFSYEEAHMSAGHLGIGPGEGTVRYYLLEALPQALGVPLMVVIAGSVLVLVTRFRKEELIPLLFMVIYFSVLLSWNMRADRYLLPLIPLLLLVATLGISTLWKNLIESNVAGIFRARAPRYVLYGLLGFVLLFQPVGADIGYHEARALGDTRDNAKRWILSHVPRGAVIATPPIGLNIPDTLYRVFPIPFLAVNIEKVAPFYDARWYDDADLIVGSDFDYDRYLKDSVRFRHFLTYYDSLRSRFTLVFAVAPEGAQAGPSIWCYQPQLQSTGSKFNEGMFDALNLVPESVWVTSFLHNVGFLVTGKNKFEKAEQVYKKILSITSTDLIAQRSLVGVLLVERKNEEALQLIQSSLQSSPDDPVLVGLEGKTYAVLNQFAVAESLSKRAISLNPMLEFPYDDLLLIYRNRSDTANAINILAKELSLLDRRSPKAKMLESEMDKLQGRVEQP